MPATPVPALHDAGLTVGTETFRGTEPVLSKPPCLVSRLCVLVFLGYAIMGAWVPVFSLHLQQLGFTPEQTAWTSATSAIAALLAPLVWGQIADRWIACERCISFCALATFLIMRYLASLTEPVPVFFFCILTWFFLVPALGLTSSLIFRQLENPERDFGKIRLWGTVGWIAASGCLSLWFALRDWFAGDTIPLLRDWSDSLRLGGWAGLVLAFYALTLPHTPPRGEHAAWTDKSWFFRLIDAPLCALGLFRDRSFVIYTGCFFAVYITLPFTIQLNPLLLSKIGVDTEVLPIYLTIAQSTEVLMLALLPWFLRRLGMKPTMLLGNLAWTVGLILLSMGTPTWLVLLALTSHGIFICGFLVTGQVFVNRQATHDIRASAQGLLLFISGSGLLLGHLLVGWIRGQSGDHFLLAYLVAAGISGLSLLLFSMGFSLAPPPRISEQESLVPGTEIS